MKGLSLKSLQLRLLPAFILFFTLIPPTVNLSQQAPDGAKMPASQSAEANLVKLTVTVTDGKGRYVEVLEKERFSAYEKDSPLEIVSCDSKDEPLSIGIIFDVSRSIDEKMIPLVRSGVTDLISRSNDANEYFVLGFNNQPQLLTDWTTHQTDITEALHYLPTMRSKKTNSTALYDACYQGIENVSRAKYERRALLLISDGLDNQSSHTFLQVRELLKRTNVSLYVIGTPDKSDPGSLLWVQGRSILEELVTATGGLALFPSSPSEMAVAFEHLAVELRHQYRIGLKPATAAQDNKWHSIKIKVAPIVLANKKEVKLYARSRQGYFAGSAQQ